MTTIFWFQDPNSLRYVVDHPIAPFDEAGLLILLPRTELLEHACQAKKTIPQATNFHSFFVGLAKS